MFSGSFAAMGMSEVLRLLAASSQTGGLHIYQGEYVGSIFLQIGQLIHADCEGLQGLDAMMALAAYTQAEFAFEAHVASPGQSLLPYPTERLIESIQRAAYERAAVESATPSPLDIPRYVAGQNVSSLSATPEELTLLLQANGRRTVADMAQQLNLPVHTVSATLAKFRLAGVIEFVSVNRHVPNAVNSGIPIAPFENGPATPQYWRGRRIS